MATLAQLKAKWFIPMDGTSPDGVPRQRHTVPGGVHAIADWTDGNTVTALIDGKNFLGAWRDEVVGLHNVPGAELYLTGWRLDGVKTLGESVPASDALALIDAADEHDVFVRILLSNHMGGLNINQATDTWLTLHGVVVVLDERFPAAGSNHFKYSIFKKGTDATALIGSIDVAKSRWDDHDHLTDNDERDQALGKATHDTGVRVRGGAVRELELMFRERWNDPGYTPSATVITPIASPVSVPTTTGRQSIQVLRTYGIPGTSTVAYTWAVRGEFTVWASYLNAIKQATTYIYIEDQYFLPFDFPPTYAGSGLARETDLVYQLGEAIKRGVRVVVLTPSNAEDIGKEKSKYHRDLACNYLRLIKEAGAPGGFLVGSLWNGQSDVYIHSKLMIVDDEVVFIGSANVCQRSMSCDGEVQLAIVDEDEAFARNLRITLWSEHLDDTPDLSDPVAAFDVMDLAVATRTGHLRPYHADANALYPPTPGSTPPARIHSMWMRHVFDPYNGPKHLR